MALRVSQARHLESANEAKAELLPVTLAAESNRPSKAEDCPPQLPSGSIHIELPGRAVISVESWR